MRNINIFCLVATILAFTSFVAHADEKGELKFLQQEQEIKKKYPLFFNQYRLVNENLVHCVDIDRKCEQQTFDACVAGKQGTSDECRVSALVACCSQTPIHSPIDINTGKGQ